MFLLHSILYGNRIQIIRLRYTIYLIQYIKQSTPYPMTRILLGCRLYFYCYAVINENFTCNLNCRKEDGIAGSYGTLSFKIELFDIF